MGWGFDSTATVLDLFACITTFFNFDIFFESDFKSENSLFKLQNSNVLWCQSYIFLLFETGTFFILFQSHIFAGCFFSLKNLNKFLFFVLLKKKNLPSHYFYEDFDFFDKPDDEYFDGDSQNWQVLCSIVLLLRVLWKGVQLLRTGLYICGSLLIVNGEKAVTMNLFSCIVPEVFIQWCKVYEQTLEK